MEVIFVPLHKIREFDPKFRDHFDDQDTIGFDLYSGDEKVGAVDDLLVDDEGRFRYMVINTGAWIFGKQVLLPIGQSRIDNKARRVYVDHLTREQVKNLPEYTGKMPVDYTHEEQVRGVYRPMAADHDVTAAPATYDEGSYQYDRDPALYDVNDRDHQTLKLYEERLIADKQRQKTGEVVVGKRVETEQARVEVPVEKERVVIERTTPTDVGVVPGEATFSQGEVARVEIYEETPEIHKEAFVREEVNVRKEVDRETVTAEDQVRREELNLDTDGNPIVEKNLSQRSDERI
jgi:uncharacterized protein (TIGR02271 family)